MRARYVILLIVAAVGLLLTALMLAGTLSVRLDLPPSETGETFLTPPPPWWAPAWVVGWMLLLLTAVLAIAVIVARLALRVWRRVRKA